MNIIYLITRILGHISPDVVFGLDSKLLTAIYPSEDLEKNDHPSTPMDEYALQTSATKATSSNAAGDVDVVHIEWFDKKDSQDTHSALTLDILSNFLSFIDQSTCTYFHNKNFAKARFN